MDRLSWYLTDLAHRRLWAFEDRSVGGRVELGIKGEQFASLPLSFEAIVRLPVPARSLPLATLLKVYLDDEPEPIFAGPMLRPTFKGDREIELKAIGPHFRLERAFTGQQGVDGADDLVIFPRQDQVDQAEIAFRLVEHGDATAAEKAAGVPGHGIVRGLRPLVERPRDREYEDGEQVWKLLTDLQDVLSGPEMRLQAVADELASLASGWRLDVFDRLGADKSERIIFDYALGAGNCADVEWTPAGEEVVNRATFSGQSEEGRPPRTYTSSSLESQLAYGILADYRGRTDVSELPTLAEHARGLVSVSAFPPDDFTIYPAIEGGSVGYSPYRDKPVEGLAAPPRCHPSAPGAYWVGDTISAFYRVPPAFDEHLVGRVSNLVLEEVDDAGNLQATPTCAPSVGQYGVT